MTDVDQVRAVRSMAPVCSCSTLASICQVGSCEGRLRRQLHKVLQHRAGSRAGDKSLRHGAKFSRSRGLQSQLVHGMAPTAYGWSGVSLVASMQRICFLEAEAV